MEPAEEARPASRAAFALGFSPNTSCRNCSPPHTTCLSPKSQRQRSSRAHQSAVAVRWSLMGMSLLHCSISPSFLAIAIACDRIPVVDCRHTAGRRPKSTVRSHGKHLVAADRSNTTPSSLSMADNNIRSDRDCEQGELETRMSNASRWIQHLPEEWRVACWGGGGGGGVEPKSCLLSAAMIHNRHPHQARLIAAHPGKPGMRLC